MAATVWERALGRAGAIQQLTEDDSWVALQVRTGRLTAAQAATHPRRNVIFSALGNQRETHPQFLELTVTAGDWLGLCSDGLYNGVANEEIAQACGTTSPQQAADLLVALVAARAGEDNVTVVTAQVG